MHAHINAHVHVCMHVRMYVCVCIRVRTPASMYIGLNVHVCVYARVYVCMSLCVLRDTLTLLDAARALAEALGSLHIHTPLHSRRVRACGGLA